MNSLIAFLGIESWKPVLTALLMPPVPFIVMALLGARTILWRRGVGWTLVLLACTALWLTSTTAFGEWFTQLVLTPPPALNADAVAELKRDVAARKPVAIVVLGSGREARAPEYGVSDLTPVSLQRLRYGVWLSRQTGAPLAFSGGVGYASQGDAPEAEAAARIAEREFGVPLRWTEGHSRDTRESAARSLALLKPAGITRVVVVTNGWHMRRSVRAFHEAGHGDVQVIAAPMGLSSAIDRPTLRWLPSVEGYVLSRNALREALGLAIA